MKIALIILAVIICVILLLLFLPLTVDLAFYDKFLLKVKYSGITLFDITKKSKGRSDNKKSEKIKKNTQPQQKDSFIKKTYKQKGLLGTVDYFSNILSMVLKKLGWVAKRFKFRRFKLDLTVATGDAADTALWYGKLCAALYPVLSVLQSAIDFKPKGVNISADFDKTSSEFKISLLVKTQLFYWLVAVICVLIEFLKLQRKEREKYERKQSEERNGHHYGQASHNG